MRRIIFSVFLCVCVLGIHAQDMASVFVAMPDQYLPQLENAWRKDLVDLYKSGKEATLKNAMNGTSTLQKLTNDYALLRITERSTMEMKLLPLVNNTHVICLITTIEGPVPDSRIRFYATDWKSLSTSDLFTPPASDWYIKEGTDKDAELFKEATSVLDMDLVQYRLSPDSYSLTATYTTPLYLDKESCEKVAPYLAAPKVYEWEKSHFR